MTFTTTLNTILAITIIAISQAGQLTFHVNNCLEEMTFVKCIDFIGSWITQPSTTIEQYKRGTWVVDLPENAKTQQGNCTYQYTNSHGTWIAFFDWQWAYLGGNSAGGGTDDVIDGEITTLSVDSGRPDNAHQCFWLYYESEGEMDCTFRTNDTICKPYNIDKPQSKIRIF